MYVLGCPSGWKEYNGHGYFFSTNSVMWANARVRRETVHFLSKQIERKTKQSIIDYF